MTLGLLHGSQPDAIVLCHAPERVTIEVATGIALEAGAKREATGAVTAAVRPAAAEPVSGVL